jgi:hypothetical protein
MTFFTRIINNSSFTITILHGWIFTNCPNTDLDTVFTSPDPWQTGQVLVEVPPSAPVPLQTSHLTSFFNFIFFDTPSAISSRVNFKADFKISTRRAPVLLLLVL